MKTRNWGNSISLKGKFITRKANFTKESILRLFDPTPTILPTSTSRKCLNTYSASGFVTVRLHRRHHHRRHRRCYHRRCHRRCCCFVRRRCCCFLLRSPLRGPLGIGGGFLPPPCCHWRESRSLQRSRLLPRKRRRLRRSPVPLGIGTGGLPLHQLWARPPQR